jgi:hypothetical protein
MVEMLNINSYFALLFHRLHCWSQICDNFAMFVNT